MFELGKHVPVVPVVTKADTMTIREANTYRTEVANRIANPMVPGELGRGERPGERDPTRGFNSDAVRRREGLLPAVVKLASLLRHLDACFCWKWHDVWWHVARRPTGIHDKINIFKFERDTLERAGVQVGWAAPAHPVLSLLAKLQD